MQNTPTLETDRLILRKHELADFADSAAMWADPDVVRYISGNPSTRAESWSRLLRYIGHWEVLGFGYWVVQNKVDAKFLGEVGFADYKRDMTPSIEGIPEAGWVFSIEAQGKGYAGEAVKCMFDWSDRSLDSAISVCIVDPEHLASIQLARQIGFEKEAMTICQGSPVKLLKRSRKFQG